jgi:hypothetical protein
MKTDQRVVPGTSLTRAELGQKERARLTAEQSQREQGRRGWAKFKQQVRDDRAQKAEAKRLEDETVARMTPQQQHAHFARRRTPEKLPDGWVIAEEELRAEDEDAIRAERNAERNQRERELGLPRLQAEHDAKLGAIHEKWATTVERCRADERAAGETERQEREDLGPRPTLDALEVAAI